MENELIGRILENAERIADETLRGANEHAEQAVAEAQEAADRLEIQNYAKIETEAEERVARAKTVAALDAKKLCLTARVEAVSECFDKARAAILALPDAKYLSYLKALVSTYAEDGDEVIVGKSDAKRVTADFVKKLSTACKKKLTLSKSYGDFEGGVVLRHNGVDKNLTLDMQLSELQSESGEVLKLLKI